MAPTQSYSVSCGFSVDPEGYPWYGHEKTTRYIYIDEEISSVSLQDELSI